jgi:FlaA1/EpsC-like NDP-sugar epimerase
VKLFAHVPTHVDDFLNKFKTKAWKFSLDYLIWLSSTLLAVILRYDGALPDNSLSKVINLGTLGALVYITIGLFFSTYSQRYQEGSIEELLIFSLVISLTTLSIFSIRLIFAFPNLPRSTPIISGLIALVLILTTRFAYKKKVFKLYSAGASDSLPTLIYGAGEAGTKLLESMVHDKFYNPVGFIDDDPKKENLKIYSRPVLGGIKELDKFVKLFEIKMLAVCINDLEYEKLIHIENLCSDLQIKMMVVPSSFDLHFKKTEISELRELSIEDIIGRKPFEVNDIDVFSFLNNKTILVTGAGGSIGSELVKQINVINSNSLFMLDRDETALNSLHLIIRGNGLIRGENIILADIRDAEAMDAIFRRIKPDIVFHAAALKHLNILEMFPDEAHKTNVLGTRNVLLAAKKYGVTKFINISTDKAVLPTSVLGKTKLITERLTAGMNEFEKTNNSSFISVRFGNVLGSNGSFLSAFKYQISNGGPVTVTHPDISRYFMTIGEAVHLVLQAATIGEPGETLILDMGKPIKIDLIAKRMIQASKKSIKITYTGLQKGEKIEECLYSDDENVTTGAHKKIMHARVKPMKVSEIKHE